MRAALLIALALVACESKRDKLRKACHLDNVTEGVHRIYKCMLQDCDLVTGMGFDGEMETTLECESRKTTCEQKDPDIECYVCDGGVRCVEHGGFRQRERR